MTSITHDDGHHLQQQRVMDRPSILAIKVRQRIGKLAPIDESHHDEYDDEAEERDRAFAHEKPPVAQ
jgi:hypothetical protein